MKWISSGWYYNESSEIQSNYYREFYFIEVKTLLGNLHYMKKALPVFWKGFKSFLKKLISFSFSRHTVSQQEAYSLQDFPAGSLRSGTLW